MAITVTGLTAAAMKAIRNACIVGGQVTNGHLILTKYDASTIDAGAVVGPQGPQGPPGSINSSPAGGDLMGNYPSPSIATEAIDPSKVNSAYKDGSPAAFSLRTLGTLSTQAAPGNHSHATSWFAAGGVTAGDPPFGLVANDYCQWRKMGPLVHVRFQKTSNAVFDRSTNTNGNFTNVNVMANLPAQIRPVDQVVIGAARFADSPTVAVLTPAGAIAITGGYPRLYPVGSVIQGDFVFMTDAV